MILVMPLTFRLQEDGMLFGAKRFHQRRITSCRVCRNCFPSRLQLEDRGVACSTNCALCDKDLEDRIDLCFHCLSSVHSWQRTELVQHSLRPKVRLC